MTTRGSVVTPMTPPSERRTATVRFIDGTPASFPEALRRTLESGAALVTIDLACVDRLDPAALRSLAAAVESAGAAGAALRFEGARPAVYKALHVAKLA
jgi:anti-anti-sigma regulatory factor